MQHSIAPTANAIQNFKAENLLLDKDNPRFGGEADRPRDQTQILDYIVQDFGVEDVLSSIAVNGYFAAEPLVGRYVDDQNLLVIVEGNRRLAACLILLGDHRSTNQASLKRKYQAIHADHGLPKIEPIPTIVFDKETSEEALLSYLGVRHIASAQEWDSYAKAVWISRITEETSLQIKDVAEMIGDQHRTVARLLEGYNFVDQLRRENYFDPEDSIKKGRGSNVQYPFSWVYTLLGFSSVRRFLGIDENGDPKNPIPRDRLADAGVIAAAMFGDRSSGRSSALNDSRQLQDLARTVGDDEKFQYLKDGKSLSEIETLTQPIGERLTSGLKTAKDTLQDLEGRLAADPVSMDVAESNLDRSRQVRRLSVTVYQRLERIASGDEGDD